MPYFTTNLINNTVAAGARPRLKLAISISNNDISTAAVEIEGFGHSGPTKEKFVEDFFTLAPDTVSLRNYFIPFDAFEFKFFVSSPDVEVSVWRKELTGSLTAANQVEIKELNAF